MAEEKNQFTNRQVKAMTSQMGAQLAEFYAKPVARLSLEMFFSISLVILLAVFAIQPTLGTIAQLRSEIEQKEALVVKLQSKNNTLQSAKQQYAQEEENIELLSQALPSTADLIPALKTLEKIATDSNVIIRTLSVRQIPDETSELPTNKTAQKINLPLTISVVGRYADIKEMVKVLGETRRTYDVVAISFNLEESRQDLLLSANLTINAPYFGVQQ